MAFPPSKSFFGLPVGLTVVQVSGYGVRNMEKDIIFEYGPQQHSQLLTG